MFIEIEFNYLGQKNNSPFTDICQYLTTVAKSFDALPKTSHFVDEVFNAYSGPRWGLSLYAEHTSVRLITSFVSLSCFGTIKPGTFSYLLCNHLSNGGRT